MKIRIEGIKHGSFAPKGGICYPKKKYLPMRNAVLSTVLQGKVTLSAVCRHEFIGSYDIDRVNSSFCQNLKRDIISLKNVGVNYITITIINGDRLIKEDKCIIDLLKGYSDCKNLILRNTYKRIVNSF